MYLKNMVPSNMICNFPVKVEEINISEEKIGCDVYSSKGETARKKQFVSEETLSQYHKA